MPCGDQEPTEASVTGDEGGTEGCGSAVVNAVQGRPVRVSSQREAGDGCGSGTRGTGTVAGWPGALPRKPSPRAERLRDSRLLSGAAEVPNLLCRCPVQL